MRLQYIKQWLYFIHNNTHPITSASISRGRGRGRWEVLFTIYMQIKESILQINWAVCLYFFLNQAVSRTQQGRRREPSVRHSVSPLSAEFCRHCVKWQNATPRFASTPERINGNITLSKYFISSSGDRTHHQSVLKSHFVPLRHDWPLVTWIIYF